MKHVAALLLSVILTILVSCASIEFDRTYKIKKGEEFVINLESNPSTGYQWSIEAGLSDSIVILRQESYQPAENPTDKPRVGAGGTKLWHFHSNKKGKTVLKFVYRRPGSEQISQTKYFKIRVR